MFNVHCSFRLVPFEPHGESVHTDCTYVKVSGAISKLRRAARRSNHAAISLPKHIQISPIYPSNEAYWAQENSKNGVTRSSRTSHFSLEGLPVARARSACPNYTRRGGWRELERDLSQVAAIGNKPLHRLLESFPECVFRLETKEFFGTADIQTPSRLPVGLGGVPIDLP